MVIVFVLFLFYFDKMVKIGYFGNIGSTVEQVTLKARQIWQFEDNVAHLKEEVMVEVAYSRMLWIRKGRNIDNEGKNDKWHHVECNSSKFLRKSRLPENDKMGDSLENWILIVIAPKEMVKKPNVLVILISN